MAYVNSIGLKTNGLVTLTTSNGFQSSTIPQFSLLVGDADNKVVSLTLTNGQIPIGSTGTSPVGAVPTSTGGTLVITPGAGTLNFEVAAPFIPFTWVNQSTSITAVANTGYFATAAITLTLPTSPVQSTRIHFIADSSGILTIQAAAGQQIRIGNSISSVAGTATNTLQGDAVNLVYRASSSTWYAENGVQGVWNI